MRDAIAGVRGNQGDNFPKAARSLRARAVLELLDAHSGWGEPYLPALLRAHGIPISRAELSAILDELARAGFVEISVTELGIRIPSLTTEGAEILEGTIRSDWIPARPVGG